MQKLKFIILLILAFPSFGNGQACGTGHYSLKVFTPNEQEKFKYQLHYVSKEKVDSLAKYQAKIKNWTKNQPIGKGIIVDSILANLISKNAYEAPLKPEINKNIVTVYTPELGGDLVLIKIMNEEKSIAIITYGGGCATSKNALVWNDRPHLMRINYIQSLEKLKLNNNTYVESIRKTKNLLNSGNEKSFLLDSIAITKNFDQNLDFRIVKRDTFHYIYYHQDFPESFKAIKPPNSLKEYEAYLAFDMVYDELENKDINNIEEIDELLSAYRTWYEGGKVVASEDGKIKIFTIEGQSCGAHCTPEYESFIHLENQQEIKRIKPLYFYSVDNIYKIDTDKYLILQSGSTGGGLFKYDVKRITCLSFDGYRLKYQVIAPSSSNSSEYDGSIEFHQNMLFEFPNKFILDYDPDKKIISYRYNEFNDRGSTDMGFKVNGKYEYKNGKFLKIQEEKTAFRLEDK